jgi:uncharacterized protein (TIGR02118 family)
MIKVSVLYPNTAGSSFDMDYYLTRHMPMVGEKLGTACTSMAVEQGVGSLPPGSAAPYSAMGHLYFESVQTFEAAFAAHGEAIVADIPNYTNVQPLIQISHVRL